MKTTIFAQLLLIWFLMTIFTAADLAEPPILFMHGVMDTAGGGSAIKDAFPGREVILIELNEGALSLLPLEIQRNQLINYLKQYENSRGKEYDLICHSQGALLCRLALQSFASKYVRNLVLMAGPQMGVYGTSYGVDPLVATVALNILPSSISSYWNPPGSNDDSGSGPNVASMVGSAVTSGIGSGVGSIFGAIGSLVSGSPIGSVSGSSIVGFQKPRLQLAYSAHERKNFMGIKNVIFLAGNISNSEGNSDVRSGSGLTGVEPWFSGILDTLDANGNRKKFTKTSQYDKDWLGLKTMMKEGRVKFVTMDVAHHKWLYESELKMVKKHMI